MAESPHLEPRGAIRGNQLVCLALLLGQAIYAAVIVALYSIDSLDFEATITEPEMWNILSIVGMAVAAASVPAAFVLRKIMWQRGAGGSGAKLVQAFAAGNIGFQVMLEGAGLLNLTLWLATGHLTPFVPVFAVLFLVGVMALFRSPTRTD